MAELLKDLFDDRFIHTLAARTQQAYAPFRAEPFIEQVRKGDWEGAAFKERIRRISSALAVQLPEVYEESIEIIERVSRHFSGLQHLVFTDFVEIRGLEHPERSIAALELLTTGCTAEFAVRPFILRYPERMYRQLMSWTSHANEHVRRLASEGCRPRLPWGMSLPPLKRDPSPILGILAALKEDPSLYVRKSVANNLNDISKDHPELVLELAQSWRGSSPETDWIIRHGCRTLLKQCRPEALRFFGFEQPLSIRVESFQTAPREVRMGETVYFTAEIVNDSDVPLKLRIEYGIDFVKASGHRSRKLFKLSERSFDPGRTSLQGKHSFRTITTRKHYPGMHRISLVVNGETAAESEIVLKREESI
ncbi:hypothetical protein AB6A23_23040 [Paenibacillus tarimensis]